MNLAKYIFNLLNNSKWIWKLPSRKEVLIYDASGSEILSEYLKRSSYNIFYNRGYYLKGEYLYISVILISIFSRRFWKGKISEAYRDCYIRFVDPKLIITFIDNSPGFYEIKNKFPKSKTLFIQNGWRGEIGDVFEDLQFSNRYHVDYMLVFNKHIASKYKKYISGETIVIGSLKNNFVKKIPTVKSNSVLFISQYRATPFFDNIFLKKKSGKTYSYREFYNSDETVLKFLDNWCEKNRLQLKIASYYSESNSSELEYFESILRSNNWEILPRIDSYSSYTYLDTSKIVVSIDSTLGYESLSRGNRTAIFSTRGHDIENNATTFGWPGDYPDIGPFWTNQKNEKDFETIMNFLNSSSIEEWEKIYEEFSSDLMAYDPGNTKFISTLDYILIS